jgi:hypothetical protein
MTVMATPDFVQRNRSELERMTAIVERLSEDDLRMKVNEHWTVAGVLGHIAFWDAYAGILAGKVKNGERPSESDTESGDVDWINDSARVFIHAVEPKALAELAIRIADETDHLVASLDPQTMYPYDESSPLNAVRAEHRGEHLDEIEEALAHHA